MTAMSGIALLRALDDGASELQQAMAILRMAGHDPDAMAVAAGDRVLLGVADQLTGRPVEIVVSCPTCGAPNEITLDPASITPYEPASRWLGPRIGMREPTYRDLDGLPHEEAAAVAMLCARCSIGGVAPGEGLAALDAIDQSLGGPLAFACVDCGAEASVDCDVERVVLGLLRSFADDVEREVHLLASTYKWDLATIESLPDRRRRRLAQLAGGSP